MNKLRIYVGLFLIALTFTLFGILAYYNNEIQEDRRRIHYDRIEKEMLDRVEQEKKADEEDQGKRLILRPPPPLPVCAKGERNTNCRPLAADETGTTVRGVRDEIQND